MTVRVERTFELPADPEAVWSFIADPEKRARPISVVTGFEQRGEREAVWRLKLPIPFLNRTIAVETEDVAFDPPEYVKFVGRSRAMRVVGEHELEPTAGGTRITNRFVVDGRLPGVERFFERNFPAEIDNLEAAIREELGIEAEGPS